MIQVSEDKISITKLNTRDAQQVYFDCKTMQDLNKTLLSSRSVKELKVTNASFLDAEAFQSLLELIAHSSLCPRKLDLSSSKFADKSDFSKLLNALTLNSTIVDLNLSGYLSGDYTSSDGALGELLKTNSTLQKLNLSGHSLCDDIAVDMARGLRCNSTLRELYLQNCFLDDETASIVLASALHLTTLDLGANNHFTPNFLKNNVSVFLETNKNIQVLLLDHSSDMLDIGDDASFLNPFWRALEKNKNLTSLSFRYCRLSDVVGEALLKTLTVNNSLISLNLEVSSFGLRGQGNQILLQYLPQFRALQELKLLTSYPASLAPALVEAMKQNATLRRFNPRVAGCKEAQIMVQSLLERNVRLTQAQTLLVATEVPPALLAVSMSHLAQTHAGSAATFLVLQQWVAHCV